MDQTDANVKRIASLEARVSELEAALEERDAMQMLLAMARRGAVNLAEAARIIAELASDARKPPLS